ncbi:UNVERIFIED_CONTAM: hypothetical protein H355_002584 [Colinus virginianus]|nr:hypothetical protein H355_002584 [Colinus virginianus]
MLLLCRALRRICAAGRPPSRSLMDLRELVPALNDFASLSLAESWDNVGLLVEPSPPHAVRTLLLTNDLTEQVMEEAVQKNADLVLSYHPPIFAPLKRVTWRTWKERLVVRALEHRIGIYSPHTAYDAVPHGVNNWLSKGLGETLQNKTTLVAVTLSQLSHSNLNFFSPQPLLPRTGMGRLCTLSEPASLSDVIERIKSHLKLPHVRLAMGTGKTLDSPVKKAALCAGSGSSVLKGMEADLYLTGEMSHHDILDAVANGISVILCEHSNTERGFLSELCDMLTVHLQNKINIILSEKDKDPLQVV